MKFKNKKVYYGYSDVRAKHINYKLSNPMNFESKAPRTIDNCAEFNDINAALNHGALFENLIVATYRTSGGRKEPRCANCQITTELTNVLTDY